MPIPPLLRHLRDLSRGRTVEAAYLVVGLFALTLGPVYTVRLHAAPLDVDFTIDAATQLFFASVYVVAALLLARTLVGWRWLRRPLLAIGALCGLLLLTTFWSVRPTETFTASVMTIGTAVFGVYLALRWSPLAVAGGLYVSSLLGVGISLWAVQRHWVGAKDYSADWAGIYLNRNSMGAVATMGVVSGCFVVASLVANLRRVPPEARRAAGVATALTAAPIWVCYRVVRHTRSYTGVAGGVAAFVGAGLLLAILLVLRRRTHTGWGAVGAMGAAAAVAAVAIDLGRDRLATSIDKLPTLSGRTIIWTVVRRWFHLRPTKGWGFMGIWRDPAFRADLDATGYRVFSAHSGYYEVALAAGWLGVVVLTVVLLLVVVDVVRWSARRGDVAAVWCTALLTYCLVVNTSESYIGANLLPWALLVAVAVGVHHHPDRPGAQSAVVNL